MLRELTSTRDAGLARAHSHRLLALVLLTQQHGSEKGFHGSKFTEQMFSPLLPEQNFRLHRCKIFPLICTKKQMMNIYQPTTLCAKFLYHEPTLAEYHAYLRQCRDLHWH